jgi:predicted RND superfamily exporter protein
MPALVDALRTQLGSDLLSIRYSRRDLQEFYKKFAAYYVALPDLQRWQQQLATAIAKQNPAYVELSDDTTDPLRELADEVRASRTKVDRKSEEAADPETGLLMAEHGHLAVMFVRPASNSLNLGGASGMLDRIQAIVNGTAPAHYGITVAGYTGSIPVAITEVAAIRRDLVSTALLVIFGVGLVVTAYFRRPRELLLMSGAVTIGAAIALGFAELWLGHVNAQTAFLGAIIVGTGINYGIILLDRYRHACVAEPDLTRALELACAQTLRATGIAAVSTAMSFGVLAAGEVEAFHQFGWIGGIGILTCWIATFTLIPACVVLADRRRTAVSTPPGFAIVSRGFRAIAAVCERAPRAVVGTILVLVAASVVLAVAARDHAIETNLRKLGTRSAETTGIEWLDNRLRKMDDRSSTPSVVATTSRAEAKQVCDAMNQHAHGDLKGVVVRCYSIEDLFPQDLDARVPVLGKLRELLDAVEEDSLSATDRADLVDLRRALDERPPTSADMPKQLVEFFYERDGSLGKLAYVESRNETEEDNLYKFTDAMRSIQLPSGKVVESSGELVVFADVLHAMHRDATKLTAAAAVLVLLVLAVVTRRRGAFLRVGGSLVAGVAIMVGIAVALGVKLNFFNFVALPTTFGIGIDYAINIEERIRQRGRGALADAVAESGPPVVLASLTSMIGYASLIPADSRALASFGVLAILGEAACVVVAVVLVPALWALKPAASR